MQETLMKQVLIIILVLGSFLFVLGENRFTTNSRLTDRIEAINFSIENGDYEKQLPILLGMRDSLEHESIFDAYNYVHVVWCLNNIYIEQHELELLDKSISDAFNVFDRRAKADDPCVRTLHMNRGILWHYLNNQLEAKKELELAKNIYEQVNDTSEEYAGCLMSMASVLVSGNEAYDLVNSRLYLEEAKDILDDYYRKRNNVKNIAYYNYMNDIALLYVKMGDWKTPCSYFEDIISSTQEAEESYNGIRALAINNLCYCLIQEGKYNDALPYALKAIENSEDYRIKDLLYQTIIIGLNQLNNASVDEWLSQYNQFTKTNISGVFSSFTEREREAYWTEQAKSLLGCNNMVANKGKRPSSLIMAYDNAIYTKTLLLKSNSLLPSIINKSSDPRLIASYREMSSFKNKLNDKNMPQDSIIKLQERINEIEKDLISSIPEFGKKVVNEIPSYQMVKDALGKNDVAIEVIMIPEIDNKPYKFYYGALVARADYDYPVLVKICEMDDIDEIMDQDFNKTMISNLYALNNNNVYQLLWKPIEPYLSKGDNVYCSLTGELNKIDIAALSTGKKRLMDIYNISIVSSTGNLVEMKSTINKGYKSALLYGGIDYSESPEEMVYVSTRTINAFSDFLATRSIDVRGNWNNLAATGYEAAQIETELKDNHINTLFLNGRDANEESFKLLSGKAPDILHIATHGFFLPEPKNRKSMFFSNLNSYTQKGESMFYSGLLFAGANNVWNGVNVRPDVDDGILTADEVSRVDLSNCKLVVLSACNTGLGTVDLVDGVFGLQRGFKQAGVGSIVMSLWKVDDQATAELMIAFYQGLNAGNTPHKALELAKRKLIKDKRFSEPYYWAAFVLLD